MGLVTGVCLASLGHEVTLRDIDARKVAALHDGKIPIYEPGLADLIAANRERLDFTLDLERLLERSDLIFIAVDTPPTYSGDADLSRVMGFVAELAAIGADPRHMLIMKSTVSGQVAVDTAPIIVNELTLVGSRCGRFELALELIAAGKLHLDEMIAGRYPLSGAGDAFRHAASRGTLKVLLTA